MGQMLEFERQISAEWSIQKEIFAGSAIRCELQDLSD